MQIDIVSDTVCPWCYIGKRKLDAALAARPEIDVAIGWRPFQLNPDMPAQGMLREEYLSTKFGGADRAERIYDNIRQAGERVGLDFRFDLIAKTPSTLNSHRLNRWAAAAGRQHQVVEIQFRRYFLEGADISEPKVLVEIAEEAGVDADRVAEMLDREDDLDVIRREDALARQMGISGVPCFIVDRKYAVSGAQDVPVFHKVFDLALNEAVEAAEAAGD